MTRFEEVVEKCKSFRKVLVTGPQRSGTTFASKALSTALGYRWIDEKAYQVHNEIEFSNLIQDSNKYVIHCPAMSHLLPLNFYHTITIWMDRNILEVIKSEDRINWHLNEFWNEKNKAIRRFPFHTSLISDFPNNKLMKDWIWNNLQKPHTQNYIELNYKHLRKVDGFIKSKIEKKLWKPKQTKQ